MSRLLDHNAVPKAVHAENGEAYLLVRLRQEQRVRSFVEMLRSSYPSTEVVARHDRTESLHHAADIESRLEQELTDRQSEVLNLTYRSGYFQRPRGRTAEELAGELDVSHPTVSHHLREAERRVFSSIFEEE